MSFIMELISVRTPLCTADNPKVATVIV